MLFKTKPRTLNACMTTEPHTTTGQVTLAVCNFHHTPTTAVCLLPSTQCRWCCPQMYLRVTALRCLSNLRCTLNKCARACASCNASCTGLGS